MPSRSTAPRPPEAGADADTPSFRFELAATPEPSVLPRVLELFTLRGLLPWQLSSAVRADGLHIALTVTGLSEGQAEHLAARMAQFPPVERVALEALAAAQEKPSRRRISAAL